MIFCSWWGWSVLADATSAGEVALVSVNGAVQYRLDLSRDGDFHFEGTRGQFALRVRNNAITVVESHCPRAICVKSGAIRHSGEVIACVPQKILIFIPARSRQNVPAITTG
ncbi:MAG: NusG domain II-containing protein [Calditrichaeota bacterium]|nr:NusG domain II-containing protein [Calditrichota bacterium]HQU71567.1 NusG domain II-containing protein [Calditrichia bacterium]